MYLCDKSVFKYFKTMNELHKIIKKLDSLPNNTARKEYLRLLLSDETLPKDHNRRLAGEILEQDNFIDKIYRKSFFNFLIEFLTNKNTAKK